MRALVTASAAVLALSGCGGESGGATAEPTETAATTPATFAVRGGVTLLYGATEDGPGECTGRGGYEDLAAGAPVTISDGSGEKVALGELGPGEIVKGTYSCEFPFSVEEVPAGEAVYTVEVAGRGGVDFTEADADAVDLSIGSAP